MSDAGGKRRAQDESLSGQTAGKTPRPPALSEWLRLMLGEIEQKRAAADAAVEERRRRDEADPAGSPQER